MYAIGILHPTRHRDRGCGDGGPLNEIRKCEHSVDAKRLERRRDGRAM